MGQSRMRIIFRQYIRGVTSCQIANGGRGRKKISELSRLRRTAFARWNPLSLLKRMLTGSAA